MRVTLAVNEILMRYKYAPFSLLAIESSTDDQRLRSCSGPCHLPASKWRGQYQSWIHKKTSSRIISFFLVFNPNVKQQFENVQRALGGNSFCALPMTRSISVPTLCRAQSRSAYRHPSIGECDIAHYTSYPHIEWWFDGEQSPRPLLLAIKLADTERWIVIRMEGRSILENSAAGSSTRIYLIVSAALNCIRQRPVRFIAPQLHWIFIIIESLAAASHEWETRSRFLHAHRMLNTLMSEQCLHPSSPFSPRTSWKLMNLFYNIIYHHFPIRCFRFQRFNDYDRSNRPVNCIRSNG